MTALSTEAAPAPPADPLRNACEAARGVFCPACRATPGTYCAITADGSRFGHHLARFARANTVGRLDIAGMAFVLDVAPAVFTPRSVVWQP